jgi:hyperosmotically inducible periplasmic protein
MCLNCKDKYALARPLLKWLGALARWQPIQPQAKEYGMKPKLNLKLMNFAAATIATLTLTQPAHADPEASTTLPLNPEFQQLDVNHDNYISRDEAAKLGNFTRAFDEADENRDGRLDRDEFAKAQAIHARSRAVAYVGDSVITAKVKAALVNDPEVKALDVSVTTDKGVVVLSGVVASAKQARRAQEIAAAVAGVKGVKSGLMVKS